MAKKKGGRREPFFEDGVSDDDLRVTEDDRSAVPVRESRPRKSRPAEPEWDTDDGDAPDRQKRTQRKAAAKKSSRKRRVKEAPKRSMLGKLFYWCFVLGIWAALAVAGVLVFYAMRLPQLSDLKVPERPPNIAILGSDGSVLVNRGARGQAVPLEQLPKSLPQAVLAIEDRRFYSHYGLDPIGLARAVSRNLLARGVSEGGSTITQQLAKNLFLTPERSAERKIQELILSLWLEAKYSKHDILEMYLNRVYLGAGTYGVEAAAQRYFGKSARSVNLQESAILAGLLKAPSRYAPTRSVEAALTRARTVLDAMTDAGYITQEQAGIAAKQKLPVAKASSATSAVNYVADWVMDLLPAFIETVESDISVETTLDPKLQSVAEASLREVLDRDGTKYNATQGAVVSMSPTGAVEALVGGRSYQDSQYNRAVVAKRQPGSAFKPFVYLAAMEQGMTPDTRIEDAPLNIKGWRPENYSHDYRGMVSLHEALALSLNTVAVRLGLEVTPKAIVKVAQRAGIASPLQANASIALGTSEVTPLELTRAYAPFANGGNSVLPYIVTRIKDVNGKVLYERKPPKESVNRVMRSDVLTDMNGMMSEVVTNGTARRASLPRWPIAGKTGTSQDFRDAWFVGYSGYMVTSVWIGNDDGSPTKRASGSTLPVEVWNKVMVAAHNGIPPLPLPGVGRASEPVSPDQPGIDDILMGGWGEGDERSNAARQRPRQGDCPLDSGFLDCVFN